MPQNLKQFKVKHPFTSLMLVAIAVRILAVIFVPGHGSTIKIGDSWWMMLLSRAFFAAVSLFTVSMVYRICDLLANDRIKAWNIALIPTICVIMPSFGIINSASFFLGLPLLLYGSNIVLRQQVLIGAQMNNKVHRTSYYFAGIMFGLSMCVWQQSAFLVLAILVMLCVKRDFKGALLTIIGAAVTTALIWLVLYLLHINPCNYIQ